MDNRRRIANDGTVERANRGGLTRTGLATSLAALLTAGPAAAGDPVGGTEHRDRAASTRADHAGQVHADQVAQDAGTQSLDIPAQALADALRRLGEATGLQVAYSTADVKGLTSTAVQGDLAPRAALRRMLRGTGLTYRFTGDNTVTLAVAEEGGDGGEAQQLGTIEVRAKGETGYSRETTTTGTRIPTSRKNVPQTIDVVPKEIIEDRGAETVNEALETAPGVTQGAGFGNTFDEFFLRGFQLENLRKNGLKQVRDNGFASLDNVERVEVLKGPSSILFGQLEPGGVVNIVTEKPRREFAHELKVGGGTFGSYEVSGDTTGPVTADGDLRYRLNASYKEGEWFPDFYEQERIFIAPSVAWTAPTDTEVLFEMEYLDDQRPFYRGQVAIGDSPADLPPDRFLGEEWDQSDTENQKYRLQITHPFGGGWQIRNATSYNRSDHFDLAAREDGLRNDNRTLDRILFSVDTLKQTFVNQSDLSGKFATGPVDHEFVFGTEYIYSRAENDNRGLRDPSFAVDIFNPVNSVPEPSVDDLNVFNDDTQVSHEVGVYANNLMSYGPFKLMLGGRFNYSDISPDHEGANPPPDAEDTSFDPRIGGIYRPIESQSLYASYSTSFNPVEFTSFQLRGGGLPEPTEGEQIEIGLKSDWLDERLNTSVAAFNITKTNTVSFGQDPNTGNFFLEQIGEVRSRGIEAQAQGEVTSGLQISAAYSFLDTEVTEDDDPAIEGNELPGAPTHQGNIWAKYTVQQGALKGLSFGSGVFARSDRPGDEENSFELPGFVRVDAMASYTWRNLKFQANVENLFDREYFESGSDRFRITPGEPRNAWFSVTAKF